MKAWCLLMIQKLKNIPSRIIDWVLYSVLTENQKESLANLFTERQKEKIRQITGFGKRNKQLKEIEHVRNHLYSKGFTHRAYDELTAMLSTYTDDAFMKRLIHWELALWHVNQMTKKDAKKSLHHLELAKEGEKNKDQLRRIAIIEAENYLLLEEDEMAEAILQKRLAEDPHPDLYFGLANTKNTLTERLKWMNKVFAHFNLAEITFETISEQTIYDDLRTKQVNRPSKDGPKVSVILPAYNAEDGIQVAIDSILNQTWQNIELIIVDDCSTDDTLSIIQDYAEKDVRIVWDQTPENSGPYVARNIGLAKATGEFVTVNDADDWSHAEKIERQVTHLIDNPQVIANTSEHARLTEDLTLYRRGTPGRYIFPNMSSLMFRKDPVLEKLGFWDSVRFAADGEFKRRLLKVFGSRAFVDLPSGPLSLPRQSVSSLTGSSAFGYNGFFMGARKEYVESAELYHEEAESLYYAYPMEKRPFPVPNPMKPYQPKVAFDVIIATDFRKLTKEQVGELREICELNKQIGLIQLYTYDLTIVDGMPVDVRYLIDGENVHRVVYGEKVQTDKLFIINHETLIHEQRYVPSVITKDIHIFITEELEEETYRQAKKQAMKYGFEPAKWHALIPVKETLLNQQQIEIANKPLGSLRSYV